MINNYNQKRLQQIIAKTKKLPNGCIEWMGARDKNGYGRASYTFNKKRKTRPVHRVIYYILKGEIPPDMIICHKCDNPSCCNIEHIFLGTYKDNSQDRDRKGRDGGLTKDQRGSKNKQAKIIESDILLIRKLYSQGIMAKELAKIFGFHVNSICRIIDKKRWNHT